MALLLVHLAIVAGAFALGGAVWALVAFLAVAVVRLARHNLALRADNERLLGLLPDELRPTSLQEVDALRRDADDARAEAREESDPSTARASQPSLR